MYYVKYYTWTETYK